MVIFVIVFVVIFMSLCGVVFIVVLVFIIVHSCFWNSPVPAIVQLICKIKKLPTATQERFNSALIQHFHKDFSDVSQQDFVEKI